MMECTMAQDSDGKGFDKSKLFVGGNLGLAFGTYTIVNVSPLVGYRFTNVLAAGVGVNYSYYGYDDGFYTSKQSYVGMSLFGRVYPIPQLFIQVQPELNYMWASQVPDGGQESTRTKGQPVCTFSFNGWWCCHSNGCERRYYDQRDVRCTSECMVALLSSGSVWFWI